MHEIMTRGGPLMWPLLACSIIALTIIVERMIFWIRAARKRDEALICSVFDLTEAGDFENAVALGNRSDSMAVRVLVAGLTHRKYGLVLSMEAAAVSEIESMKRGLSVLDTIITMAPLLGILGTVAGIIESFDLLGEAGIENPRAVTGGIAQALLTTAAGLSVAIVTLMPYNAYARRVEKVSKYLEKLTTHFEVTYQKGLGKEDETQQRL